MLNIILAFLRRPRNILAVAAVGIVVFFGIKYVQAQNYINELERLRNVDAQVIAAHQQNMIKVLSYSSGKIGELEDRVVVLSAPRPLDKKAARAFVHAEILEEIEKQGSTVIGGTIITVDLPETEGTGTTTDTGADNNEETLEFQIQESTWIADFKADLVVTPQEKKLDYTFSFDPKPQSFKFYTVKANLPDGRPIIQIWADVPGEVLQLDSFIVEDLIEATPQELGPQREFYIGGTAFANTRGEYVAGPELGFTRDLWKFRGTAGIGFDVLSGDTFFSQVQLRLRF